MQKLIYTVALMLVTGVHSQAFAYSVEEKAAHKAKMEQAHAESDARYAAQQAQWIAADTDLVIYASYKASSRDDQKKATKNIQNMAARWDRRAAENARASHRRVKSYGDVCPIASDIANAAFIYKIKKEIFPYQLTDGLSPFSGFYAWAILDGTHRATSQIDARMRADDMCLHNILRIVDAAKATDRTGRLVAPELSCPYRMPKCE